MCTIYLLDLSSFNNTLTGMRYINFYYNQNLNPWAYVFTYMEVNDTLPISCPTEMNYTSGRMDVNGNKIK